MSRKLLSRLCALYLAVPTSLFLIGWTPPYVGWPLAALTIWMSIYLFRGVEGRVTFGLRGAEVIVGLTLLLWALHAGIGEFMWQNRGDHFFRNALFYTLAEQPWPVVQGDEMLCYYFGFWLPAGLTAKLTGSLLAGRMMETLWAFGGLWLTMRLVFEWVGSVRLRTLAVFILFSGIDIIPYLLYGYRPTLPVMLGENTGLVGSYSPLAWWTDHCSSLYWVYNQMVPGWLGTMLLLQTARHRCVGALPLILAMMLVSAPLPAVGLLPAAIWLWSRKGEGWREPSRYIGLVAAVAVAIPLIIFLGSNASGGSTRLYPLDSPLRVAKATVHIALVLVFEVGVFIPFIWRQVRRDTLFYILLATSVVALMIRTGHTGADFPSRVAVPMLLYVSLQVARFACSWSELSRRVRYAFVMVALLASLGPVGEIVRSSYHLLAVPPSRWPYAPLHDIFDVPDQWRDNFIAPRMDA